MPGYLSHLAARVVGSKSGLRPRIPSIFEPARGMANFSKYGQGLRAVEQEFIVPEAPTPVPTAVTPERKPASVHSPVTEHTVVSKSVPSVQTHLVQEAEAEASSAVQAPAPRNKSHCESDDAPKTEERTTERIAVQPKKLSTELTEEPRRLEGLPVQRVPEPLPEPPRIFRAEIPQGERSRVNREESRKELRQSLPELASPSQRPIVQPVVQRAARSEHRSVQSAPEPGNSDLNEHPSVQVTIGRLIVEAVAPAPTAAPRPSPRIPAPRLSLDDYLRQRRSQA